MNEASTLPSKVCASCGTKYPGDALFCPSDGSPLQNASAIEREAADPYLGQEISGHIEIRQLVGVGAMGRVYRAFQRGIDRDVAVKILHRELSANQQLVSRFTREAKVASRLQHPNVVQVLLAGQLPDRALYMVMEYLDGLSLQSALAAAGGALPLPRALHIVLQLCEASGEAHTQGIVHRDLKPENVMLVKRGPDADFVKVLDFGIARINWGEQSVATAAGLIFGTARYISPEGAQGNAVGPASDVYSIATLLYQMLSGRTPFEGDQAVGLLVQQIHDPAPSLKSFERAKYVPDSIAEVIMANLAKDPKKREQDARGFGQSILDATKAAGLSTEDFSRPLLRRQSNPMHLPPMERTKQHELTPELLARMTPTSQPPVTPDPKSNGNGVHSMTPEPSFPVASPRAPMAGTAKWEPPEEFQAKLAGLTPSAPSSDRTPSAPPTPPPAPASRPRSIDETMDDASLDAPNVAPSTQPPTQPPTRPPLLSPTPGVARTVPGDPETPSTHYAVPVSQTPATPPPVRPGSEPSIPTTPPQRRPSAPSHPRLEEREREGEGSRRGVLLVLVCFVLGMLLAAGWAWRTGKFGSEKDDQDRVVSKATDALFKNRFGEPPGDNVRDITDEGLKKWPNERRLLDIRVRASNELTNQAVATRAAGDVAEALRLAKLAHELDPNDASSKKLAEQYENELSAFTSPSVTPLKPASTGQTTAAKPQPSAPNKPNTPTPPGPGPGPGPEPQPQPGKVDYKVALESSNDKPRLGQTVELSARVLPSNPPKAGFEAAGFTIVGPGVPGGVRLPAQSSAPGVFKATYAFLESGKFDVTFSVQADTKALSAKRTLSAGESSAPQPPHTGPTPPTPTPTGSVKWM